MVMVEEEYSKIDLLVQEAQLSLSVNPQDSFHEIEHHRRTWENACEVVEKEKVSDVDWEVLETICWWHDVSLGENESPNSNKRITEVTAEYISEKFDGDQKEKVYDSIKNHEFGSSPKYLEGKILQDADKLDFFSEERVQIALKAIKDGKISKEHVLWTLTSAKDVLIPNMRERFNFQYSKSRYDQYVDYFVEYLNSTIAQLA